MARTRTVVVAGAGIGGLAAAIGLARARFRALVLERADALEDIGAGIQLSPNATRALSHIGVLDRRRPRAGEARALVAAAGGSGRELARLSLAGMAERYGTPYLLALRGDLPRGLVPILVQLAPVRHRGGG